jgi:alkanesulfonate monooxygenase SsuD/methylene tetrahydromethanopterin reductase-like flavin-dependent oxidoreductase (luciferase family)
MSIPPPGHAVLILEVDGAGAHPAAWRLGPEKPDAVLQAKHTADAVVAAESAGFHAVSLKDSRLAPVGGPGARLDAIQRAAYLGPLTHSIGLIPVADAIYTEPFHLATQLAALDSVSGGRAGWIVSGTGNAAEGAAVGREPLSAGELRGEVADVVEVGRRLWDSWEDGAVIKDLDTGKYLDRAKIHYADFTGQRFSLKGSSISERPIQGQLPVLAPEHLAEGQDAVLFEGADPEALLTAAAEGSGQGRRIAELEFVLDAAGERAASRLETLDGWENPRPTRARFIGTAAEFTDYLLTLLPLVAGVRLHPAVLSIDAPEFAALVLPELRRAGLLAPINTGNTLRDLLGLPVAANRFVAG